LEHDNGLAPLRFVDLDAGPDHFIRGVVMAKDTGIEWTDSTWNPWYGCEKISAGCRFCYALRDMERFGKDFNTVTRAKDATFYSPDKWDKGRLIFTCSWSDWFIQDADKWRDEAWAIVRRNPHHIFQILTKRPERIRQSLPDDWGDGYRNVWLGISAENQEALDLRVHELLEVPAALHFLSAEPLIGPIPDLFTYLYKGGMRQGIRWVIVGGESGSGTDWRTMKIEWVDQIFEQCKTVEVPFFFKQWAGTKKPGIVNNRYKGQVIQEMPDPSEFKPTPQRPMF
jgi:protein gp37